MYVRLWIPRNVDTSNTFVADIKRECDKLAHNGATHAAFGDMYVKYGSNGISLQFGHRIFKVPAELSDVPIVHVELEVPRWDNELHEGMYRRRRAWADVQRDPYITRDNADTWRFVVHSDTLRSANRLFDDIVTGRATPRLSYRS